MGVGVKVFLTLLCNLIFYFVGILIFTKGFLLNRLDIEQNSTCIPRQYNFHNKNETSFCMPARYKRAVFIIIDALRYDFAAFNQSISRSEEYAFQNKLTIFHDLLSRKPQHARLYRFWADPPTTTMQRIKGLTTGSLPTFVDVSSNFGSTAVIEDNFIHQLLKQTRKLIFLGDDTWNDLFPDVFHRSYFYPSLDFKDLHRVDNGILEHLKPELQQVDWDVMIAHFLGVDHCGHRFGPYHAEMGSKLKQMNAVISSVIDLLTEDTILFVLGDHGMTRTGDHGGDSQDELDAALFVYSPSTLTTSPIHTVEEPVRVSQIDLVPTVSLLLGLPIPFSNLGSIITDLFNSNSDTSIHGTAFDVVEALRINAHQVNTYLKAYFNKSQEFPLEQYANLEQQFNAAEVSYQVILSRLNNSAISGTSNSLLDLKLQYEKYLKSVRDMCEAIWAKFDTHLMLFGIALVVYALSMSAISFALPVDSSSSGALDCNKWIMLGGLMLLATLCGVFVLCSMAMVDYFGALAIIVLMLSVVTAIIICNFIKVQKQSACFSFNVNLSRLLPTFASVAAYVCYSAGFFSNSFVVFEDATTNYLLNTLILVIGYQCVKEQLMWKAKHDEAQSIAFTGHKSKRIRKNTFWTLVMSPVGLIALLIFSVSLSLRFSMVFRICREEQWDCLPSIMSKRLSTLPDELQMVKNVRCIGCFIAVVSVLYVTFRWMRSYGNMNGDSLKIFSVKYCLPIAAVCLFLNWSIQLLPQKHLSKLTPIQTVVFARLCYVWCIGTLGFLILRPLCLFVFKRDQNVAVEPSPMEDLDVYDDNVVPKLYHHLRKQWWQKKQTEEAKLKTDASSQDAPPVVFGLATVFSSSLLLLFLIVFVLLCLLLGDSAAPSLALQAVGLYLFLELYTYQQQLSKSSFSNTPGNAQPLTDTAEVQSVTLQSLIVWSLFGAVYYFATGHQSTVPTIRWDAAYVGFIGDFPKWMYFIPGMLITLNTFASSILCTITVPLLLLWPAFRKFSWGVASTVDVKKQASVDTQPEADKGEFALFENYDIFILELGRLFSGYLFVIGFKVLSTACAAMHHQRHLMVWKIFAPRFVFQAADFFVTGFLLLFTFLFLFRIMYALKKWLNEL